MGVVVGAKGGDESELRPFERKEGEVEVEVAGLDGVEPERGSSSGRFVSNSMVTLTCAAVFVRQRASEARKGGRAGGRTTRWDGCPAMTILESEGGRFVEATSEGKILLWNRRIFQASRRGRVKVARKRKRESRPASRARRPPPSFKD